MRRIIAALAAVFVAAGALPAFAQKVGGNLRVTHRDNPPSASIHEEATISTVMPFMSVYNNLVIFDPKSKQNAPDQRSPRRWRSSAPTRTPDTVAVVITLASTVWCGGSRS